MAGKTEIEWSDFTWNPVRGCSRVSPGCGGPNHQGGCYAEKIAARFSGPGQPFEGFAKRTPHGGQWTGKMALAPDHILTQPLRWKRPRRIFVNSMSDLFHENLPDEAIDKVFAVMALAPQHTFQVLTKRAARMREYFAARQTGDPWAEAADAIADMLGMEEHPVVLEPKHLPLPNVWLGVSVEDPDRKHRIDELRATPAAVRFLSLEPLLDDIGELDLRDIHQVIVGGESGPKSRVFWAPWARSILRQCRKAKVACFIKQMGANVQDRNDAGFEGCDEREWHLADEVDQVEHNPNGYLEEYQGAPVRIRLRSKKGGDMSEWPEDLRVREFPT